MLRLLSRSPLVMPMLLALAGCKEPAPAESPAPAAPEPAAETAPAPRGKRAPCTLGQDQTCNDDPTISSFWGRCTELGVCECREGFELAPWGRCRPAK